MRAAPFAFILACLGSASGANLSHPIAELTLLDGRTLRNVEIVSYSSSVIMAKWDGGRGTLDYRLFPESYQAALASKRPKPSTAKAPDPKPKKADAPSPSAVFPAPTASPQATPAENATRRIAGEIFLGGGESQSMRVKFAAVPVVAYPLATALSALETMTTPILPAPIASVETDSEGRFEIEVPSNTPFLLIAKARHRAARGGRVTDWEWRIAEAEISGNRVMLHDRNAFSAPRTEGIILRR